MDSLEILNESVGMSHGYSSILVTGGTGFIGSHIVDGFLNDGFEVTVLDNLSADRLENVAHHQGKEDFHFIKGDMHACMLLSMEKPRLCLIIRV